MLQETGQNAMEFKMSLAKTEKIRKYLLVFIILFLSDDLFLTWNFAGEATIRLTQLAGGFLIGLFLLGAWQQKKIYFPRFIYSLYFLLGFCVVDGLALFSSYWLIKSMAYFVWLIYNFLFVLTVLEFVHADVYRFQWLMQVYMYSFAAISVFTIIQFLSGMLTGWAPLLEQWWIYGSLPRANGISYEPSYLVTYLLPGLCFWGIAWRDRWPFIQWRGTALILVAAAVWVSGSRMGWLGLILFAAYLAISAFGKLTAGISWRTAGGAAALLFLIIITGTVLIPRFPVLLRGTGIAGTASTSYTYRYNDMQSALTVFANHPLLGVSLGGVGAAMSEENPQVYKNQNLWSVETGNITAELLAGTGMIGCLFFYLSAGWILWYLTQRRGKAHHPLDKSLITALIIALIMEIGVLQGNQNVLRYYFWFQLALTMAAVDVLYRRNELSLFRQEFDESTIPE